MRPATTCPQQSGKDMQCNCLLSAPLASSPRRSTNDPQEQGPLPVLPSRWLSPLTPLSTSLGLALLPPPPPLPLHQARPWSRLQLTAPVTPEGQYQVSQTEQGLQAPTHSTQVPRSPSGQDQRAVSSDLHPPGLAFILPAAAWPFEGWRVKVTGQLGSRRPVRRGL